MMDHWVTSQGISDESEETRKKTCHAMHDVRFAARRLPAFLNINEVWQRNCQNTKLNDKKEKRRTYVRTF